MDAFRVIPGDLARVTDRLRDVDRKALPMATRWALNDMAFAILEQTGELADEVFDRPTRWTKNAFFVRKATLQDMTAVVERKTAQRGRHYLEVQQEGGRRPQTGLERLLSRRLAYSGLIAAVLPTDNMRKDRHGNMSRGAVQRIISNLQASGDAAQNTTQASRARARGRRAEYFVPRDGSSLSPGVYERGTRGGIKKMLAFSETVPNYSARYPMEERGRDTAETMAEPSFRRALARALAQT